MRLVRIDNAEIFADGQLRGLRLPIFPLAVSELGRAYYASIEGEHFVFGVIALRSCSGVIL